MRIEPNLTAELDGKRLKIRWKNRKLAKQIREVRDKFLDAADKIDEKKNDGKISESEAEAEQEKVLAEFYRDQCDVMFEFDNGTPDVEWFMREDFPVGQMEFLQQVFTNPQIQT